MPVFVGTAGWSVPRAIADRFAPTGSGLERYASAFDVVEINSSFHRPHRVTTWQRWRDSVPAQFRFSVKVPKEITHVRKLADCEDALEDFFAEASGLGPKLAVLLVQLPPKLAFDHATASAFFKAMRDQTEAAIVCEPRNMSWFAEQADLLLEEAGVARVAADPSLCEFAARPGGWRGLSYWRLHGSPVVYRSSYEHRLESYAARLLEESGEARDVWCIFDNTASSAGAADALGLRDVLRKNGSPHGLIS